MAKAKSRAEHAIEIWPIGNLKPYERNPRKNDQAVDRMVASIREFGFKIPVLARSSGEVVDGHLRLKAALRLNVREIPVILCDEWTDAQVKAFRLMVNRSVGWAEWDPELLSLEFAELKGLDFDLNLTGFEPGEIEGYLGQPNAGLTDEDAVPETPTPRAKRGDVWLLGKHRLMCGDATSASDVGRLLGDIQPNLMVTDPPYGVSHDPAWREKAGVSTYGPQAKGLVSNDDRIDWSEAYALFPGSVAYVWHADRHASSVQASIETAGFIVRCQIIWAKPQIVFGRGNYHWQHEPCWYAVRKGKSSEWTGDRKQSTLWSIQAMHVMGGARGSKDNPATGHSTQKPVECMRRPILNHTNPGQCVYDPFMGSGTTIIAAESTGRVALGLEIDPVYVDVAVLRWELFTGQHATLEQHG